MLLVQATTVIKPGLSSDRPCGSILNVGLGSQVAQWLAELAFVPSSGSRVVVLG